MNAAGTSLLRAAVDNLNLSLYRRDRTIEVARTNRRTRTLTIHPLCSSRGSTGVSVHLSGRRILKNMKPQPRVLGPLGIAALLPAEGNKPAVVAVFDRDSLRARVIAATIRVTHPEDIRHDCVSYLAINETSERAARFAGKGNQK
jgi:hypothetical protein